MSVYNYIEYLQFFLDPPGLVHKFHSQPKVAARLASFKPDCSGPSAGGPSEVTINCGQFLISDIHNDEREIRFIMPKTMTACFLQMFACSQCARTASSCIQSLITSQDCKAQPRQKSMLMHVEIDFLPR